MNNTKRMKLIDYVEELDWNEIYTDIFIEFENETYDYAKTETDRIFNIIREEYASGKITDKDIIRRVDELKR